MGKICAFFGHRDAPLALESSIEKQVRKLITEENVDTFWIGGYGNFDSLATKVLNKLQKDFPHISIILIIAYPRQLHQYDKVFPFDSFDYPPEVESAPYKFAISARNRYMAKNTDFVIAYINREYGGAYDAFQYTKRLKKNIINLSKYYKKSPCS